MTIIALLFDEYTISITAAKDYLAFEVAITHNMDG
jgi:hypothetical protein